MFKVSLARAVAVEGKLSRQEQKGHHARGPHASRQAVPPGEDFRRNIRRGPDDEIVELVIDAACGEAKVNEYQGRVRAGAREEQVLGLDVTVQHTSLVAPGHQGGRGG